MEKTGNTTISMDKLDYVIWMASEYEKRALNYKKSGKMDFYYHELTFYLGIKFSLEMLGLVIKEDYDFSKEA